MRNYYIGFGIGKTKYMVCYHDETKTHPDGSQFYDMKIFTNKKKLSSFVQSLIKKGYYER